MDFVALSAASADDGEPAGWFDYGRDFGPAENQVAPVLDGGRVLARTDDVALLLSAVRAYPAGVQIELELRLRTSESSGHQEMWETSRRTLVGVELPDGTRVVGRELGPPSSLPTSDQSYRLTSTGGGGGGRSFAMTYWLTPGPPPGDLTLVVVSPLIGPVEGRHTIAAQARADALARSIELWPWQPDVEPVFTPPDPPKVPPGGWFAKALG